MTAHIPAISLIDTADAQGRIRFKPDSYINQRSTHSNERDYLRECIKDHLRPLMPFISIRFDRTVVGFNEAQVEDDGISISFSLAPVLLLPSGSLGLVEFRGLLVAIVQFFIDHREHRPSVTITNNKDRRKKTYGKIKAYADYQRAAQRPEPAVVDAVATDKIQAYISDSQILTEWLRQVALDLNRLGPHSWMTIRNGFLIDNEDLLP